MAKPQTGEQILQQLLRENAVKDPSRKAQVEQALVTAKSLSGAVKSGIDKNISSSPQLDSKVLADIKRTSSSTAASVSSLATTAGNIKEGINTLKDNSKQTNTLLKSLIKITETNLENTKEQFEKLIETNNLLKTEMGENLREQRRSTTDLTGQVTPKLTENKKESIFDKLDGLLEPLVELYIAKRLMGGAEDLPGIRGAGGKSRKQKPGPRGRFARGVRATGNVLGSLGKAGGLGLLGGFAAGSMYSSFQGYLPESLQGFDPGTVGAVAGGLSAAGSLAYDISSYRENNPPDDNLLEDIADNVEGPERRGRNAKLSKPGKITGQNASGVANLARKKPGIGSRIFGLGKGLLKSKVAGRIGGGLLGAGLTAYEGYEKFQELDAAVAAGEITKEEADKQKVEAAGGTIGGVGGALAGAAAGAAIGSVVPVVGTAIGGIAGGLIGGFGGEYLGKKAGQASNYLYDKTTAAGDYMRSGVGYLGNAISGIPSMLQYNKDLRGDIGTTGSRVGQTMADSEISSKTSLQQSKEGNAATSVLMEGMSSKKVDPIFGSAFLGSLLTGAGGLSEQFLGTKSTTSQIKDGGTSFDRKDLHGQRTSGGLFGSDKFSIFSGGQETNLEKNQYQEIQALVEQNKIDEAMALLQKFKDRQGSQFDRVTGEALTGFQAATRNYFEDQGISKPVPLDQIQASRSNLADKMKPEPQSTSSQPIVIKGGDTINNVTNGNAGTSSQGAGSPSRTYNPWDNLTIGHSWSPI